MPLTQEAIESNETGFANRNERTPALIQGDNLVKCPNLAIRAAEGSSEYNAKFFDDQIEGSIRSARGIIPLVLDLVEPKSVVDVGCGLGAWLRVCSDNGIEDVLGIDGDYVDISKLYIPVEQFRSADLNRPPMLDRRFDLAISLEVAEHLQFSASSDFVRFLTSIAPVILFSAAIPMQGGTNHINEQWPWFWKELFAANGYTRVDSIRPLVWRDLQIEWWYKQNVYLYVQDGFLTNHPKLNEASRQFKDLGQFGLELVGESILRRIANPTLRPLMKLLPKAIWRALTSRIGKLRRIQPKI